MSYWRATFAEDGTLQSLEPLAEPTGDWEIVEAETEDQARVKAVRKYFARKKRERIARLHAEGRCRCSRMQDRPGFKTCSVCALGRQRDHEKQKQRAEGQPSPPRDEGARVETMQATIRDRKASWRLEVLLEVKRWWREAPHTEAFAQRLATEILVAGGSPGQTSTPTALAS